MVMWLSDIMPKSFTVCSIFNLCCVVSQQQFLSHTDNLIAMIYFKHSLHSLTPYRDLTACLQHSAQMAITLPWAVAAAVSEQCTWLELRGLNGTKMCKQDRVSLCQVYLISGKTTVLQLSLPSHGQMCSKS